MLWAHKSQKRKSALACVSRVDPAAVEELKTCLYGLLMTQVVKFFNLCVNIVFLQSLLLLPKTIRMTGINGKAIASNFCSTNE